MSHGLITLLVIALILIIFGTLLFLNLRAWDHFDQGVRETGDPTGKFGNKYPKTAMALYGLALIWGAHVLWTAISSGNIESLGSDAHYRESSSPALFWIMFTGWLVFTLVVGGRFLFKVGQLSKKY